MYFQQKQIIRGLALRVAGSIKFEFDLLTNLSVILTRKQEKEFDPSQQKVYAQIEGWETNQTQWPSEDELLCIVKLQREPSPKVRDLFDTFVQGGIVANPEDVSIPIPVDEYRSAPTYAKQASQIPESLNSFATQIHKEMHDYGIRTLRVLRWRANATCPHNPVHGLSSEFSIDGKTWFPLPISPGFYFDVERDIRISEEVGTEIVMLVKAGNDEPLAHILLREAWNQRKSNPRSSLLIGMSAAEIGIKQCIGNLIPDASWLLENLPSPPLVQILTEYIPQIPAKLKINDRVVPPPELLLKTLKDGVNLRNKVVHTGRPEIKPEKLGEILHSVEDLLWLLDYYCGHDWALNHMRVNIRTALGINTGISDI
jgi:hypothetical protein